MSTKLGQFLGLWFARPAWQKIVIALFLGIATGLLAGPNARYLKPVGTIFINAIHMLVVPVVFTAIVCAVLSLDNFTRMKRATIKAGAIYLGSAFIAATLGIVIANLIGPGLDLSLINNTVVQNIQKAPTFAQIIVNFVPSNPVQAFAAGNVIQILVVALLFGFSIKLAGERAEPVARFFQSFSAVVFKFAEIIVSFAPYGIFALIAFVFGQFGLSALAPLLEYIFTVYLACFVLVVLYYCVVLAIFRIHPLHFIRGISEAIAFAYTTSSSAATLPITMRCVEDNLGVDHQLSRFFLPLGTSFNLNGLSIYLSIATIFAANVYGMSLDMSQYFTIVVTIAFTAFGAAAVPGSALIVVSAVMTSVGIPLGALSLIAGVDRFNDMAQTATNVIGDCFATALIAKTEKMMKQKQGTKK